MTMTSWSATASTACCMSAALSTCTRVMSGRLGRCVVVIGMASAPRPGGLGQGVALLAARTIGDDPDRVDPSGPACGDDHAAGRGRWLRGLARLRHGAFGCWSRPAPMSPPANSLPRDRRDGRPDHGARRCCPAQRGVPTFRCASPGDQDRCPSSDEGGREEIVAAAHPIVGEQARRGGATMIRSAFCPKLCASGWSRPRASVGPSPRRVHRRWRGRRTSRHPR